MKIKGQSKAEFQKNYKRIKDIVDKAQGDKNVEIKLARLQANKITDEAKSINRAMAAKELKNEEVFQVFFRRAYQLGVVKTLDYRDYVLSKLLENEEE